MTTTLAAPTTIRSSEEQHKLQRELADKITSNAPLDEIRILLACGAKPSEAVTQGLRPLHYACYRDYEDAVRLLLLRGALVDALDEVGYSPLHLCAEHGNYHLIKLLLEYMARVCFVEPDKEVSLFPRAYKCEEPLRLAIKHGHYDCARLLLEHGANPNARYFHGSEITQVRSTDIDFLQLLLMFGADPNVYDRDGLTPMMKACRHREKGLPAVKLLLEYDADINALAMPKQDLRTPLHYGVLSGSYVLVDYLIEHGANVNMPSDYDKPAPLDLAVLKDDPELVSKLIKVGASPNAIYTYIGSPLHLACCSNLTNQYEIIEILLRAGADVNLSHCFPEGGVLKTPMVEYFRSREVVDPRVVKLMFAYGGKAVMKSPISDARGQLRNLLKMQRTQPDVFLMLASMGEQFDVLTVQRLPFPLAMRMRLVEKAVSAPSLQHLCRLRLRELMAPLRPEKVQDLPLPKQLKDYVLGAPY